jgi:subtilisin family serine protease
MPVMRTPSLLSSLIALCLGVIGRAHAEPLYIDPEVSRLLSQGQNAAIIVEFDDTMPAARSHETGIERRQRRQLTKDQALSVLPAAQHRARRDFNELPDSSLTLTHADGLKALTRQAGVSRIFWDRPLKAHLAETLPLINQPQVAQVMGRQGAGVGIAVLDTGVDYTRSAFGSCTSPGVPSATCRVVATYEAATNDNALDAGGHGTEVAMTALAVAPKANIIAVDVFNGASASSSDVLAGINWVIAQRSTYNIGVINLSLGDGVEHATACGTTDAFYAGVRNARNAGISVVVSSGNEGYSAGISSPACVAQSLATGAVYDANVGAMGWYVNKYNASTGTVNSTTCWDNTTMADQVTCFSDSGLTLDVLAPGAMVTLEGNAVAGTSFSAPLVSGALAVLKSQFPTETAAQLEARITGTGKAIIDPRNGLSRPRLDLLAAQGAPTNDNFASATALNASSGGAGAWNYNASVQTGEPAHAGLTGGHSLWWRWTAPTSGTLILSTQGSGFDTLLGVYSGASVSTLQALASDDDSGGGGSSTLRMAVTAGQTYAFAVDGKAGATGTVLLNWDSSNTPFLADLALTWLQGLPAHLNPGQSANWVAQVTNNGPQVVGDARVTFTWPLGLNWVSGPFGCVLSGQQATCPTGTLNVGATATLNGVVSTNQNGSYSLDALVSSTQVPDATPNNNDGVSSTTVSADAGNTPGDDSDVPLPPWSYLGLSALLLRWLGQRGPAA